MNLNEFEQASQQTLVRTLEQLQIAMLLLEQLRTSIEQAGASNQSLAQTIDTFIQDNRNLS